MQHTDNGLLSSHASYVATILLRKPVTLSSRMRQLEKLIRETKKRPMTTSASQCVDPIIGTSTQSTSAPSGTAIVSIPSRLPSFFSPPLSAQNVDRLLTDIWKRSES